MNDSKGKRKFARCAFFWSCAACKVARFAAWGLGEESLLSLQARIEGRSLSSITRATPRLYCVQHRGCVSLCGHRRPGGLIARSYWLGVFGAKGRAEAKARTGSCGTANGRSQKRRLWVSRPFGVRADGRQGHRTGVCPSCYAKRPWSWSASCTVRRKGSCPPSMWGGTAKTGWACCVSGCRGGPGRAGPRGGAGPSRFFPCTFPGGFTF